MIIKKTAPVSKRKKHLGISDKENDNSNSPSKTLQQFGY